jgi:hypothetical protein
MASTHGWTKAKGNQMMKGRNIAMHACLPWIYTRSISSAPAPYAGIVSGTDGGSNWENMCDGIPAGMTVTPLSFNAVSRQLAASIYGRGVYMIDLNRPPMASISSSAKLAKPRNCDDLC